MAVVPFHCALCPSFVHACERLREIDGAGGSDLEVRAEHLQRTGLYKYNELLPSPAAPQGLPSPVPYPRRLAMPPCLVFSQAPHAEVPCACPFTS